jgi:transposase
MSSPEHTQPRWIKPVLLRQPASEQSPEQQTLQLDAKSGTIALFRYGLIAPLVLEYPLPAGELPQRAREIAARVYDIPYSKRTSVCVDSLLGWVFRYRNGGFEALAPKPRQDRGQSRTINPQLASLIEHLKRENPNLTVAALLRELRLSSGHDSTGVSASTLYRFLKQRGLLAQQLAAGAPLKPLKKDWRIDFIGEDDRRLLTEWRRSKDKNLWQKAVTVLENSNLPPEDIAKKVERPLSCIRQWIKAFKCSGIKALNSVRKPRVMAAERRATLDQKRKRILEIVHGRPHSYGINRSSWNLPSLALAYRNNHNEAISKSTVSRLLKESDYTIKKARKVLSSPDPEYREKVDLVLHTLQNLEPLELFFFVDELGPMQVKKYGGRTFVPKNEPYTFPELQKSRGVIHLAGALNAVTNQVTWVYGSSKDTAAMVDLIELLFNQHTHSTKIYITWDSASWHRSNVLVSWLDAFNIETLRCGNGPLIYLVPLPTSSQFLDVIEAVFSGMKKAVIHHSNYQSEQTMKEAISRHFEERNAYFLANPRRAGQKIWELNFFKDYGNLRYGDYRKW